MATDFQMPKLGLTMEEGTIIEWLVPDGADVTEGTPVLRIETDKVETEVEVAGPGRLAQFAQPGETFACGAVIGALLAPGETAVVPSATPPATTGAPSLVASSTPMAVPGAAEASTSAAGGRMASSPNARRVAADSGVDIRRVIGTGPGGRIVSEDVEAFVADPSKVSSWAPPAPSIGGADFGPWTVATAAARQLADLLGVHLGQIPADTADGRVTRDGVARHVRALLASHPATTTPATAPSSPIGPSPAVSEVATAEPAPGLASVASLPAATQTPTKVIRMTGMRGTIAKRMHASLQSMAQLTLTMDASMDAVIADRQARRAAGAVPGFTDYVLAAAARALAAHPGVNAQVTGDGVALLPDIHVGLAVALDSGLMVPVVKHADRLTLADLSEETSRLAAGARSGSLPVTDYDGGTFSVSALGMFGVDAFTPVINPPNVAILGVGRIRDDLELVDGVVVPRKRLTLSLTWDHRVLDGAPAAEFCRTIVQLLETPSELD